MKKSQLKKIIKNLIKEIQLNEEVTTDCNPPCDTELGFTCYNNVCIKDEELPGRYKTTTDPLSKIAGCSNNKDCPYMHTCINGKCIAILPGIPSEKTVSGCSNDNDCPGGQRCVNGTCQTITSRMQELAGIERDIEPDDEKVGFDCCTLGCPPGKMCFDCSRCIPDMRDGIPVEI